jgi:hypothetical protein
LGFFRREVEKMMGQERWLQWEWESGRASRERKRGSIKTKVAFGVPQHASALKTAAACTATRG